MRAFHVSPRLRLVVVLSLAFALMLMVGQPAAATPLPPTSEVTVIVVTVVITPPPPVTPGDGPHHAGLVVRFDDGSYLKRCVSFTEEEISGDELLLLSGLQPVIDLAGAVCAIGGQGCPADDCFCQCPFPDCKYWAYFDLIDGQWEYSQVGPAYHSVRNGDVDGWSWGDGNFSQGVPPPVFTFEQICPASALTPSPTATGNYTPTPRATFTPAPTATATPTLPLPPAEIPEPATVLLLGSGIAALGLIGAKARGRRG